MSTYSRLNDFILEAIQTYGGVKRAMITLCKTNGIIYIYLYIKNIYLVDKTVGQHRSCPTRPRKDNKAVRKLGLPKNL